MYMYLVDILSINVSHLLSKIYTQNTRYGKYLWKY